MKIKLMLISTFLCSIGLAHAQGESKQKMLELYGFGMTDVHFNFKD